VRVRTLTHRSSSLRQRSSIMRRIIVRRVGSAVGAMVACRIFVSTTNRVNSGTRRRCPWCSPRRNRLQAWSEQCFAPEHLPNLVISASEPTAAMLARWYRSFGQMRPRPFARERVQPRAASQSPRPEVPMWQVLVSGQSTAPITSSLALAHRTKSLTFRRQVYHLCWRLNRW
jgi:hypothetical protein